MEMVIGFDFEADARNFALLESLYECRHFFLLYRNTGGKIFVLLNSKPGGEHSMLHVFHDYQTKGANI